jgi:uncharacterized protein YciI
MTPAMQFCAPPPAMKYFVVEVTYAASIEKIDAILSEHRAFLQTGYDRGWLLMSGPQNPRTGGIVIARAPSLDELQTFFRKDPYQVHKVATYRFVEFTPVKRLPLVESWANG